MIWITLAVLAGVGWALSTFTHELSHVIANKMVGRRVVVFKPWPHFHRGRLYFGRASSTGPTEGLLWVHASPLIEQGIMIALWVTLALTLYLPLLVLAGAELIDTIWWLKGYFFGPSHTDGAKFRAKF